LWQPVALRQIVQREKVDEVQAAQHGNDRAALRERSDLTNPRLVHLDLVEEALVERAQDRVGCVGLGQLAIDRHGSERWGGGKGPPPATGRHVGDAGSYSSSPQAPRMLIRPASTAHA